MSSNSNQIPTSSKAVNISAQPTSSAFHSTPSVESGSQRRAGGSGSFGAGLASRNSNVPRNNQSRKNLHKRQRRPGLLDDDEYNESAIMKSTNSRKGQTSITHLMNFSLPPRPQYQPPPRNARRYASWGLGSGYHAMDKARYVHANYRFIVAPNKNYHAQAANADVHLDWNSVLQVLVSAQTQAASCPICLSTPTAPRMARCGHIFCLPCLIRYMNAADENAQPTEKKPRWKKCPICWDSVYTSETRPVRWFRGQEGDLPFEGSDVVLRLVKREPGSTLALPRDGAESIRADDDIPWYHAAEVADYARIMKGGEDYMSSQYDSEIEDLQRQALEDELMFGDDTTWSRKAIATIRDAKEKLRGIGNPPDVPRQSVTSCDPPEEPNQDVPADVSCLATQHAPPAESSSIPNGTDPTVEAMTQLDLNATPGTKSKQRDRGTGGSKGSSQPSDHPFYFYQALPQFYLSPLDVRILKTAWGEYGSFPATILPRVEHISTGHIVDDELRKRMKYLSHLPQGCEVNFLECDWRDVVVPEVLGQFRAETDRRRKRNKDKETREEKDRLRAEKEDDKRWAAAHHRRSSIPTHEPPFSARDFQPLMNNGLEGDFPQFDVGSSSASPPQSSSQLGAPPSPSNSPPSSRTVWGTTAIPALSQSTDPHPTPRDGWLSGWEDELMAQQESEILAQSAAEAGNPPPTGGKKKKNKKITLMSTNVRRGA
ncbi:hypothetical protein FE257_010870 [Aspergillus nanangensis]|uniref:RING-type domain-containing protein n=1 Tax=Aspergillus nanangensis TaxID=2582783 RepID=A0AAD4CW25_ASPNN|nr:hypothetical protein FE257_010870 [Aspergillus nanangensis]